MNLPNYKSVSTGKITVDCSGYITDQAIMDGIKDLIRVAAAYGASQNLERSTVSWRLFGDSKKLDGLVGGADIQVRRYEAAMAWLSDNWPPACDWPVDVRRPNFEFADHSSVMAPADAAGAGIPDRNVSRTEAAS